MPPPTRGRHCSLSPVGVGGGPAKPAGEEPHASAREACQRLHLDGLPAPIPIWPGMEVRQKHTADLLPRPPSPKSRHLGIPWGRVVPFL